MGNKIEQKIEKGFFGFWVRRFRVSFLVVFLIIAAGIFSLFTIPKESNPDIKFGIISITTPYIGVNPDDIDSLITDKIEKEIKDIEGIKKITSSSFVGISSIVVELDNDTNTRDALTDINDAVDKVVLPIDAEDPSVYEISSSNELMFEVLLYGDQNRFSQFDLINKSQIAKSVLEGNNGIASIDLGGADIKGGATQTADDYEINVLLDLEKIEQLGLNLREISNIIKSYNKNTPIGNYIIGELNYDFRFDGELASVEELKNVVIKSTMGSNIILSDISEIKKEYKNEETKRLGFYQKKGFNYASMVFNKAAGSNVFDVSSNAKEALETFIKNNPNFDGLEIMYTKDMSELIIEDYNNLSSTAVMTLVLVFITILMFVGFRESLIASMLLPLSFLVTFIVLDTIGFSLNFLTNFSLVLTLGIAIDTMIVIIEGASEKIKLGYNRKNAVLFAVHDYKAPLIAGTMTTLVAFLPLMFLPGVMGRFLSYIPITVFSTLVAALLLSLTISSALFVKFVKDSKYYHIDEKLEATYTKRHMEFLKKEREGKKKQKHNKASLRDRVLMSLGLKYYETLKKLILSRKSRIIVIITPILLLILTFLFLSPKIGFTLFPETDNAVITSTIETKEGTDKKVLEKYLGIIDNSIYEIPEVKVYYTSISGNKIDIYIELFERNKRKDMGLRNVFEVEEYISDDLKKLETEGLSVSIETLKEGPPTGKAVGIKLIANNSQKIDDLKKTANIFKEHFKTIEGTKNVSTTSSESPGQFIFKFDNDKLAQVGLIPDDILGEVYFYTNGLKSGSIKSEYEDNDIVLKIGQFDENLSPDDINNLIINTHIGKIRVGDFANYKFTKAVSAINREDSKISITVEADVLSGILPSKIQPELEAFAKGGDNFNGLLKFLLKIFNVSKDEFLTNRNIKTFKYKILNFVAPDKLYVYEGYDYPEGIIYKTGGENEENADLIMSTVKSFFIAIFLIFSILVFQFNSYTQPLIVIYSVALALLGVNIGLFATGNPYSMTFMIGFIALTGVVVNDAIILIDRINKNLEKGIDNLHAVIGAGKARLQPIIVTTLTTVFGVLPLAMQDEFWAGLGFTIVFGLIAGSTMTLFVIPSLYYEVFLRKEEINLDEEKKSTNK